MLNNVKNWLNKLYEELTIVNETPHRVALSFAMGVFLGILPFTGVLAAIAVAIMFRLNKAAAILGSAITNTWLGLIVLGLAVKIGSGLTGANWQLIQEQVSALMKNFSLKALHDVDILQILCAIAVGYFILSCLFALIGYVVAVVVISWHRRVRA